MIVPPNINEAKINNMLIPISGLRFSIFLIIFVHSNVLLLEKLLIPSVSTSHSSIPINLANFLLSRPQLWTFHEYPF